MILSYVFRRNLAAGLLAKPNKQSHAIIFFFAMLLAAILSFSLWLRLNQQTNLISAPVFFGTPAVLIDLNDPKFTVIYDPKSFIKGYDYPEYLIELNNELLANEKIYGKENPILANMLEKSALAAQKFGRTAQVEQYLRRTLAIREQTLFPGNPKIAQSHLLLAEFYYESLRYPYAFTHYLHHLNALDKNMPEYENLRRDTLEKIIRLLFRLKNK